MPTPTNNHIEKNTAQPSNSASWRHIIALVVILLLLRIIYLVWLSPYELAGDEAQYWDWSRNLDWSYYSKGPGVAWAIAAATRILGDHEWSIRLPAVLAWAISMLTIARLGQLCSGGDRRVGLLAALLFLLTPAYFAAGQFMTIDAPFFACWLLSILAAWHVFAALRHGRAGFAAWGALAATLGIGFLFKYTIALLLPGLILYAWLQRKDHTWTAKSRLAMLGCIGLIAIIISPVFIWNQKHGWPTLTHLFGHLHLAGGDVTEPVADAPSGFSNMLASLGLSLLRILEMIGTQIGIVGVPIMILIVHAVFHARRRITKHSPGSPSPPTSTAHNLLLICCALPVLVLYLLVAFRTKILGNWPLPGFLSLLVLAAIHGRVLFDRDVAKTSNSKPGKRTWGQALWHWIWGWGIVGALLIGLLPMLVALPLENNSLFKPLYSGLKRVTGYRERAKAVNAAADNLQRQTGRTPMIITDHYGKTARLAFYLPGKPVVFCAQRQMGDRPSGYDLFANTKLSLAADPQLQGRDAVLVGAIANRWDGAIRVEDIRAVAEHPMLYTASDYQGLRSDPAIPLDLPGSADDH